MASPHTFTFSAEPAAVFEAALTTLRVSGYDVTEYDEQRLFIQVKSRVDGDVVAESRPGWGGPTTEAHSRTSHIGIQFFAPNSMMISVSGYHVREGRLDPRVAAEIDSMVRTIYQNAGLPARFERWN